MKLYINANRTGYAPDQIRHTMTVGELIDALREFDEDAQVYLRHDGGAGFRQPMPGRCRARRAARRARTGSFSYPEDWLVFSSIQR